MENNMEPKALSDLIENPSEISAIISDPADSGVKFYQALPNKDKQYVAFAAGIGLIAYGLFLNRSSKKSGSGHSGSSHKNGGNKNSGQGNGNQNTSGGGATPGGYDYPNTSHNG
jgi:hypothetical protein